MKIADFAIENRVVTLVLTFVVLGAGMQAFQGMSRLEDPEFTIKDALVVTPYSGASANEVEEEVTDEIEKAVQKLSQLSEIESRSVRGMSTVTVTIKDSYDKSTLPQVWDELRRKVGDAQKDLPPGAGPSMVVDDFGDVYGIFFTVSSDEYSYAELKEVVDLLRRELLLVEDVAKIETYGERREAIYVELDRDRISQLGIPPQVIVAELQQRNLATDSGRVRVGREFITLNPTGEFQDVADFENLLLSGSTGSQIYLRDVATVRRGYVEPSHTLIRYDGTTSIGVGISTISGGNVVTMGQAVEERFRELRSQIPLGVEVGIVSLQSSAVTQAISGFTTSLLQAVAIVVIVLLFFMGLRSGLLIGFILLLTIIGSFIFLAPMGVALERISLGALIIALGMLVDNAIVIVDGMLIRMQKGTDPKQAASEVVAQSAIPLLGATVIAILAFAAIGTSEDSTGEFCRSLYQVVLVSLLFSWVTAVTVTPLLGILVLKAPKSDGKDPYESGFYRAFKGLLRGCIRARWATVVVVLALFAASVWGFQFIEQSFFPPSTRPQLMVDFWLPQGTHIEETQAQVEEVETYIQGLDGVTHVTSLIGQGALRFLLTYTPEKQNDAFAQLLVDVDDPAKMDGLITDIEGHLDTAFPDALGYAAKFQLGPGSTGKIQARFTGQDANTLRELGERAAAIFESHHNTKAVKVDWRERVKAVRPILAEQSANLAGIHRSDVATALLEGYQGKPIGVYRERDLLLPVILRAPEAQRRNIDSINDMQIWSAPAQRMIPLRQVIDRFETSYEDEIIIRRDRKRTLTVFADPIDGPASKLFAILRPQIEALEIPEGYTLEWGGEYEDSAKAQGALAGALPMFIGIMILVTIGLFNSLRQPTVIWLNVPLALIGVTVGLLATGQPFGFMALLGFLSLIGMLIKNAIVLVDEINLQHDEGKDMFDAIIDSAASRLRPVAMAASTTALGMIPLLFDAFFVAMATTIIAGLMFATVLTMIVLPVLYAIFFNARATGAASA